MTGKVVSLSRARKARDRDDARKRADANAAKHGRTKAERRLQETQAAKENRRLDDHKTGDD